MDQDPSVSEVLEALIDPFLDDESDTVEFLHSFVERCRQLLGVTAVAVLLADDSRRRLHLASTSTPNEVWSRLPYDQGPAGQCLRSGEAFFDVDVSSPRGRWADFARQTADAGVGWTSVLPLHSRGHVVGVLSLMSDRGETSPVLNALSRAAADLVVLRLGDGASRRGVGLSARLGEVLNERVLIEQAVGVLAARARSDVEEARTRLRALARASGTTLRLLAQAVVSGEFRPDNLDDLLVATPLARSGAAASGVLSASDVWILARVAQGLPALAVAEELQIEVGEVGRRLSAVRVLLGVTSTAAAVNLVRERGGF